MRNGSGTMAFNTTNYTNFDLKSNKKSLNKIYRKQELVKITIANHKLMKRLNEKQSHYRLSEFNRERVETEKVRNFHELKIV